MAVWFDIFGIKCKDSSEIFSRKEVEFSHTLSLIDPINWYVLNISARFAKAMPVFCAIWIAWFSMNRDLEVIEYHIQLLTSVEASVLTLSFASTSPAVSNAFSNMFWYTTAGHCVSFGLQSDFFDSLTDNKLVDGGLRELLSFLLGRPRVTGTHTQVSPSRTQRRHVGARLSQRVRAFRHASQLYKSSPGMSLGLRFGILWQRVISRNRLWSDGRLSMRF